MHFCANEKNDIKPASFNGQFLDTPGTNFSPCTDNKHEGKFQIVLVSF